MKNDFSMFLEKKVNIIDPIKLYGAANGIKDTQDLVKCNNCSLIYENLLDEELIIYGYANSNEDDHDTQYHLRVKSFYNAISKLKIYYPRPLYFRCWVCRWRIFRGSKKTRFQ